MYLCEEYMARHNIKVPYAKVVNFGANFIKNSNLWNILTVTWKEPKAHPGHFVIKVLEPQHNGYEAGSLFVAMEEYVIYYDE